ncbi:glutathione S-transferase family protein [Candidatus Methylospira mobilis]|uniref:Glutathione S-transferase family protein n=1 Tax=Candidatus Methylospira mobilis TaxID=1808979 RepID=A0A5Q0BLD1_9GAMM|nr:glutathione S-transferase family protein [Candidatus Methylospira mobilis]QFY43932.1 glutathione S-transferase family protein [Candidatus Methylospira mobilis]WNV04936.1 glutathione S-transferase family protein [Candidatus Methylospira mobilis]
MKLYDMELSGNCYKIRLFCALLGLQYQSVAVDLTLGEHKQPAFLQLNPRGQVPVLDDGGTIVWDSLAILTYLARKYGNEPWLPLAAEPLARVMQWLALSENELLYGLARARAVQKFKRPWDLSQCQALGKQGLAVLERRLSGRQWLADDHPTLADIACYPYVALSSEGDIALDDYPHVCAWLSRIQALPGYIGMPGI